MPTPLSKGAYAALVVARWKEAQRMLAASGSLPVLVIGALPGPTPDTTVYTYLPAPEIVYNLPAILRDLANQCEQGFLQGTPQLATLPAPEVQRATNNNGSNDHSQPSGVSEAARAVAVATDQEAGSVATD